MSFNASSPVGALSVDNPGVGIVAFYGLVRCDATGLANAGSDGWRWLETIAAKRPPALELSGTPWDRGRGRVRSGRHE